MLEIVQVDEGEREAVRAVILLQQPIDVPLNAEAVRQSGQLVEIRAQGKFGFDLLALGDVVRTGDKQRAPEDADAGYGDVSQV